MGEGPGSCDAGAGKDAGAGFKAFGCAGGCRCCGVGSSAGSSPRRAAGDGSAGESIGGEEPLPLVWVLRCLRESDGSTVCGRGTTLVSGSRVRIDV
eukprot:COSAG01_NODE_37256_length_506_cov_0.744472_1_plen_95_part_10